MTVHDLTIEQANTLQEAILILKSYGPKMIAHANGGPWYLKAYLNIQQDHGVALPGSGAFQLVSEVSIPNLRGFSRLDLVRRIGTESICSWWRQIAQHIASTSTPMRESSTASVWLASPKDYVDLWDRPATACVPIKTGRTVGIEFQDGSNWHNDCLGKVTIYPDTWSCCGWTDETGRRLARLSLICQVTIDHPQLLVYYAPKRSGGGFEFL